ncbi:MAG: hypothetical protein HRT47_13785 [Candidatus Caenarcaniphilales bacterium]|nr:hypothetical protein [Candidatus Caenarcaniphilales bacterium]
MRREDIGIPFIPNEYNPGQGLTPAQEELFSALKSKPKTREVSTNIANSGIDTIPPQSRAEELDRYLKLMPDSVYNELSKDPQKDDIREVILKTGSKFQVLYAKGTTRTFNYGAGENLTPSDLESFTQKNNLKFDDIKLRANIPNSLHRVTKFTTPRGNIENLHIRYGTQFAKPLPTNFMKELTSRIAKKQNIVFMGVGGVGKTTTLRELAKELTQNQKKRVMVVDPEYEICGPNENSTIGVGQAERVVPFTKAEKSSHPNDIKQRMTNMSNRALAGASNASVIFDELLSRFDAQAVAGVGPAGANAIASFHGDSLDTNLILKFAPIFGNPQIVTVSDDIAKLSDSGSKNKFEVDTKPVMDALIEITQDGYYLYDINKDSLEKLLNGGGRDSFKAQFFSKDPKAPTTQNIEGKFNKKSKYSSKQERYVFIPNYQKIVVEPIKNLYSRTAHSWRKQYDAMNETGTPSGIVSQNKTYFDRVDKILRSLTELNAKLNPQFDEWGRNTLTDKQIQERMNLLTLATDNVKTYMDLNRSEKEIKKALDSDVKKFTTNDDSYKITQKVNLIKKNRIEGLKSLIRNHALEVDKQLGYIEHRDSLKDANGSLKKSESQIQAQYDVILDMQDKIANKLNNLTNTSYTDYVKLAEDMLNKEKNKTL